MYSACKHKGPIQLDTENQYTGTKFTYKGPTVWAYGDTMHAQMNNPIGTRGTCVYKGPTLWEWYAQIEDQFYEHTMRVQSSILWDAACSYTCEEVAVRNASTTMQANN